MYLSISCIICARNELSFLRSLVPYLLQQDIKLVVIDNDSSDGIQEWLILSV